MKINIIVAICKNNGIGLNNTLPWNIKSDLKKFKTLTCEGNNAIIMGKNTWNSLPIKPLPKRDNLILSTSLNINFNTNNNNNISFKNIDLLLDHVSKKKYDNIWIIGGEKIYNDFLKLNCIDNIFVTYIDKHFECDTYFPKIDFNKYKFISQNIHKSEFNNNFNIFDRVYKKI